MTLTSTVREIEIGMSNFDGSIDEGFAEALQAEPGKVFGCHAGWNFNGRVWFADGQFHEEVRRYGSIQEVISATSLKELMEAVCDKYGYQ